MVALRVGELIQSRTSSLIIVVPQVIPITTIIIQNNLSKMVVSVILKLGADKKLEFYSTYLPWVTLCVGVNLLWENLSGLRSSVFPYS